MPARRLIETGMKICIEEHGHADIPKHRMEELFCMKYEGDLLALL